MGRITAKLLLGLMLLGFSFAQGPYSAKLALDKTLTVTSEPNSILILPAVSAPDGSIFVHLLQRPDSPLVKIWPDGQKSARITLQGAPEELRGASLGAFAVSASGEIYVTAIKKKRQYLIRFDADSKYRDHSEFETLRYFEHIAAIDDRTFIGTGIEGTADGKIGQAFTVMFTSDARLLKELDFPGDSEGGKSEKQDMGETRAAEKQAISLDKPIREAAARTVENNQNTQLAAFDKIVLGCIRSGFDGKVYVLRHATPALIYVLDSTGKLERELRVAAPEPGMQASEMQVNGGRIALEFTELNKDNGKTAIKILDTSTGEVVSTYLVSTRLGGAFAIYTPDNRFGFLGADDTHLAILWAKQE